MSVDAEGLAHAPVNDRLDEGAAATGVGEEVPSPLRSRVVVSARARLGELVLATTLLLAILIVNREDILLACATACLFAIATAGLGLALGLAGEFMLAQVFLFAVAAYSSGWFASSYEWSFWVAAPAATFLATAVGIVYSFIGLRVSQFYFAMIGFFVVAIIPDLAQVFRAQTGGNIGMSVPGTPSFFGAELNGKGIFALSAALLVATVMLIKNVRRSPLGVEMRRLRDDPVGLGMSGVPVWRTRVTTYAICSFLAGLSGAVYSHVYGYLQPSTFSITLAILFFAAVLIGGRQTLWGPIAGVALLYLVPNTVLDIPQYADLIYGALVLLAIIGLQGGVIERLLRIARTRLSGARRLHTMPSDRGSDRRASGAVTASPPTEVGAAELAELLVALRREPNQPSVHGLVATGLKKRFGGLKALDLGDDDVVRVERGGVHLLIGANGSGKTTLLNGLCGLNRLDQGIVALDSRDITNRSATRIAVAGIGRSFQSPKLPGEVTPVDLLAARISRLDPVWVGHWLLHGPVAARRARATHEQAARIAASAGLGAAAHAPCDRLTSGQRRIVDVLLALTSGSEIVLLDEPAAGLSGPERARLAATITALRSRGVGFLLVEHDLELAMSLANVVTVLSDGRILAQGSPDQIQADANVRRVLMGESA